MAAASGQTYASSESGADPLIGRVENGLLPPALVKGQKAWNILDRIKLYNIPGVSVAVFFDKRVQWAKGYGVADNGTKEPVTERTLFIAGSLINEITMSVAKEYGRRGYVPAPYDVVSLDAKALAPFPGRYTLDSDSTLAVSLEGGRLMGNWTGQPAFELLPISAAEFIRTDRAVTYDFADGKGTPSGAVTMKSGGGKRTAPRAPEGFKAPADWLEAGDTVRAVEGYRSLWKKDPKDPSVAESRLNSIGYYLLSDKKMAEAIALFKLNVELHSGRGPGLARTGGPLPPYSPVDISHGRVASRRLVP